MKWSRWHGHKNHLFIRQPPILMEVDGEHYKISNEQTGEVFCEDNGHSQQYAKDLCEAWYIRHRAAELQIGLVSNG